MTKVYFVRHALPDFNVHDDLLRPLTQEGTEDSKKVTEFLLNKNIDKVFSYNNFNICLKILCNSNSYRI